MMGNKATYLRDRLGTLRDSVLREFTREDKSDRGLDFTGGDGGFLGISSEF